MAGRVSHAIIILLFVTAVAGCPSIWKSDATKEEPSAQELFNQAEAAFAKESYRDAIELYERVRGEFPEFDKKPQVYVKIADAYFELGEFEDAISRYDQFLGLYPASEEAPRAKYMEGMAYFKRIGAIDRDNRYARSATKAFKRVVDESPNGEWKDKAEEKYRDCRKKLGEKELYKARQYQKLKRYKSAGISAQRVLDEYGDLGLDKEAKEILEDVKGR